METNTRFLRAVGCWADGLGGLRDVVRQALVAAQLAEGLGGRGPLRVLDAGCGQGTQALRLASAGHEVTGLDISEELLDRFALELSARPSAVRARVRIVHGPAESAADLTDGLFDVVVCHGVLMYFDDVVPLLTALSRIAREGAVMSLVVRNGLAPAMRDGLRGNWAAAGAAFDSARYTNRLGLSARTHTPSAIDVALAPLGWQRKRWFGVRVFSDHREGLAPTGAQLDLLLAAEQEAARRDPYRSVAALLHLIYSKSQDDRTSATVVEA
ncbi:MAG TPA: methyltransferase domain-containing protein [Solirubrobacteraceae bacterium]|nr:methyltransferase domain-containing protein [Solirubrobacteraceae bacterium]